MHGVWWPEPKFLAIFPSLDARRFSVRTKFPGKIYQFECEARFGQNQNSRRYFSIGMRGVCRSGPKFLAIFPSLNARRVSVRTKLPGGIHQFECEVFFGQNRNSWQYAPVKMRGVFRPDPNFLAIFPNLNARCFSVRTKIPGCISQFKFEVVFVPSQYAWQYFPV